MAAVDEVQRVSHGAVHTAARVIAARLAVQPPRSRRLSLRGVVIW